MGHLGWAERRMRLTWFGLFTKLMASTPSAKDRGHACRTPGLQGTQCENHKGEPSVDWKPPLPASCARCWSQPPHLEAGLHLIVSKIL